jgi:hypothetical protein
MAHSKNRQPRSTTPPKGRPTPPRADAAPSGRDTVTLQWTALGLAVVGIVAGLVYFGGDWGGDTNHGGRGGHGAPAVVADTSLTDRFDQAG